VLAPQRKQRPVALIAGLVAGAFILLLIGVMAGFTMGLGGKKSGAPPVTTTTSQAAPRSPTAAPDGPKAVTEKFLNAALAGDEAAMRQHLCRLLKGEGGASTPPGSGLGFLQLGTLMSFKIGEEKITGPAATVKVELTVPLIGATSFDMYLLREDGGWRVCGAGPS
jgi:hypothetical protein